MNIAPTFLNYDFEYCSQLRETSFLFIYKKTKVGIVPEEWEEKTVGKCIIEYDEKTTIENQYPVLTSARSGLMLQSEYYSNNQVTTSDNVGYTVDCQTNKDIHNKIAQDIDDLFYDLEKNHGFKVDFDTIDKIIENVITVALRRFK